jgi:catechol 2,3-dioxygenase-like lactoylglutathione lyase family enzyme
MPSGREQIGRRKETALDQRLSLVTLGVRDISRAQAFYEALGWHLDGGVDDETDHVAFFQTGGVILALWDRGKLARDSGVTDTGGWGGVTLAYNVRSPEEVDAVLAQARAAGATIARSGSTTLWGGYSGVFVERPGVFQAWGLRAVRATNAHPSVRPAPGGEAATMAL